MTSNVAIGNTAAASLAPTPNAAPSVDMARVLNPTAFNGGTPIYGDGQLMAAGPRRPNRPASPATMMQNWSQLLQKRVAPGAAKPAGFVKVPFIPAPTRNKDTSVPALFNKSGKTWKVPGVPAFKGQINGELMESLDRALTAQRVQDFQSLSPGQQVTARTLIGAALQAMSLPKGNTDRIDPKHMDTVVETALTYAQQTPTALDAATKPSTRTPTTKPVLPASTTARTPTTQPVPPAPKARMRASRSDGPRATPRQPRSTGSTGSTKQKAAAQADAVSVLAGTDLIRQQRLTPDAAKKLGEARAALGLEVGRPADAIPPPTAALKVLSDYWTARVTSDPAAFDKARSAQSALTQSMKPLRQGAAAQSALAKARQDYRTTIDSIRQLKPTFDVAAIGATKINDATLAELKPKMPAEDFAKLELETAQRYLAHYQAAAAAKQNSTSPTQAAETFLVSVSPQTRQRWESRLIGGPTLQEVVQREARAGGELTVDRVNLAVLRETRIGPPKLPENTANVVADQFYEIRYGNATEFAAKLSGALRPLHELPMQIRTADGSRYLQIYRHGSERNGTTITDEHDRMIAQPNGSVAAISEALNVKPSDRGAIVVSYGSSPAVMRHNASTHRDARQVVREGVGNRAADSWLDTRALRRIAAERGMTTQARLARLEGEYASFQRSFEAALLEPDQARREAHLKSLLKGMQASAAALGRDAAEPVAKRAGQLAQAAAVFTEVQRSQYNSPAGKWARSIEAERAQHPPASGQTVTQRWLATVNELMRRDGVPEEYRNPLWQAKVLVQGVADMHYMQGQNPAPSFPAFDDEAGMNVPMKRRTQIVSSPTSYLNYLESSAPAWETLKKRSGLGEELWFHQLQVEANNGGVLKAAQLDKVAQRYHNARDRRTLVRAQDGFRLLDRDFSKQLNRPPPDLRANRPVYTEFVEKMRRKPFLDALPNGPFADVNFVDEIVKAGTLASIGWHERQLRTNQDPATVQRALDEIDRDIALGTQVAETAQSPIPGQSVQILRNFRALVERLRPTSP